jgi:hypothetical protein
MLGKPFGIILLVAVFLGAGIAGVAGFWLAVPRSPGTSPLAMLVALAWTSNYVVTGVLTWRGSRLAAPAFLAAMAFLLLLLSFIFPERQLLHLPLFLVTFLFASLGYWYLRKARVAAA